MDALSLTLAGLAMGLAFAAARSDSRQHYLRSDTYALLSIAAFMAAVFLNPEQVI